MYVTAAKVYKQTVRRSGVRAFSMSSKFIYGLVIFSSAFLLFQVQPLLGKMILPWFGGSAGLWIVCLLFFQFVLLLGYLYAHLLTRRFRARTQTRIHAALLCASLLVLPILPKDSWRPSTPFDPALHILLLLGATVGLPYFLLSATSPLLQAWYARKDADAAPYRLYAVSNIGSLLALVSYPVLMEPWVGTSHQALGWSWSYAAVALLCAVVALSSVPQRYHRRTGRGPPSTRLESAHPMDQSGSMWLSVSARHQPPHLAEYRFRSAAVGDSSRSVPANVHPMF